MKSTNIHDCANENTAASSSLKNFSTTPFVAHSRESSKSSAEHDFQIAETNFVSEAGKTKDSVKKIFSVDLKPKIEDIEDYSRIIEDSELRRIKTANDERETPESAVPQANNLESALREFKIPQDGEETMEHESTVCVASSEQSDVATTIANLKVMAKRCVSSEKKIFGLAEAKRDEKLSTPREIVDGDSSEARIFEETMEHESIVVVTSSEQSDVDATIANSKVMAKRCVSSEKKIFGLAEAKRDEKLSTPREIVDGDSSEARIFEETMEHESIVVVTSTEQSDVDATIANSKVMADRCVSSEEKIFGLAEAKRDEKLSTPREIVDGDSSEARIFEETKIEETVTSLALLAQAYENSDSESEEPSRCVREGNIAAKEERDEDAKITKEYRNKQDPDTSEEETSEEEEDSSETSCDSSSSDEESQEDEEQSKNCRKKNERNRYKAAQEKETKGEYDDLPPIEELKISVPEVLCDPLGEVGWMVEQMVVVKPKIGKPTLNLDTILFVERGRRVLGRIFDVFGQVSEPHYCVRFNNTEHIKESDIKVGMIVYFCPNTEYTSVVFLHDLLKMRATDEIGDDEQPEFSDDEEERAYYAAQKQRQKNDKTKNVEVPQKRQRTDGQDSSWKSNHPWSTGKKQQHTKKLVKSAQNTNERSLNQQQQQQQQHAVSRFSNTWQYSSSRPNDANHWPIVDSNYSQGDWQINDSMQNQYGYNVQYSSPHQHGPSRPFFRPARTFAAGHDHYGQIRSSYRPSSPSTNSTRFTNVNFPWQTNQTNGHTGFSWSLPPPPPPPPGI